MRLCQVRGLLMGGTFGMMPSVITVRSESTDNFHTISFSDDRYEVMLQIPVTPEVKKILKEVVR